MTKINKKTHGIVNFDRVYVALLMIANGYNTPGIRYVADGGLQKNNPVAWEEYKLKRLEFLDKYPQYKI